MGDRIRDGPQPHVARASVAAILFVALVIGTGCGGSSPSSRPAGAATSTVKVEHVARDRWTYARARFREMCAGCHTLADADAHGKRFNLDHEPSLTEVGVREIILGGGPGMPSWASSISFREYEELTRYILTVARRRSGDDYWRKQIGLRLAGETRRPPGWPPKRYLKVERFNP